MRVSYKYLVVFLLLGGRCLSQLNFSALPNNLQMFARDENNFGHFKIEGTSAFDLMLRTEISKKTTHEVIESFITPVSKGIKFSINHSIPAMMEEFNLSIFQRDSSNSELLVKTIQDLVAGDFYIIAGQSNAECGGDNNNNRFDSMYTHRCNRSLGVNFNLATGRSNNNNNYFMLVDDYKFGRPSANYYASIPTAFTGIWPLKLQHELSIAAGIPLCFVNGAVGGARISESQASHTPSNPDSLRHSTDTSQKLLALPYDRLYKKLYHVNVLQGVKGIFWYQGESDGNFSLDTALNYANQFTKLRKSWKSDYPNLKKIIVLQINVGCSGNFLNIIRETQRTLPQHFQDVEVMSTVGSNQDDRSIDNCHYSEKGYEKIADNLVPLAKKHFYQIETSDEFILPANIIKAYYVNSRQICLEFNKTIFCEQQTDYYITKLTTAYIKDYFYSEDDMVIPIATIEQKENKLYFNLLSSKKSIKYISYLPNMFTNIPTVYAGPWILNAENAKIGAYSFYKFPVEQIEEPKIHFYPNPSKDELKIEITSQEEFTYSIYDQLGILCLSSESKNKLITVNLSALMPGIYLLKVNYAGKFQTHYLIHE